MRFKLLSAFIFLFLFTGAYAQENVWYTTVLKEKFLDKNGNPVTGKGVVVGDIDSGIDIFHPFFFFADGGSFAWLDVDKNGKFTPGLDAVDLDGDGIAKTEETLRYIEIANLTYMLKFDADNFNPDMDFLYVDANGNKKRDFGEKDGFTEADPTYGEQLFIAIDENKNGTLDVNEKITGLKTSKVRAVREKDGTIRRRGTDLIKTEPDSVRHGTGVSGIVLGGHYGVQKMHGFAPDAELVMANIKYDYTPRFVRNFPDLVKFIRDEKVNILLFEDGEWMHEFMDGSTPEELLTNEIARSGITVIGGGGNLASGNMLVRSKLKKAQLETFKFSSPATGEGKKNDGAFVSLLWKGKNNEADITVLTPDNIVSPKLNEKSGIFRVGNYNINYSRTVSPRGTVMIKFAFSEKDSGTVKGDWQIRVHAKDDIDLFGFIVDVTQSWGGTTRWYSDKISDEGSVTFPSTADSLIAVGAYTVNFPFGKDDKIGGLCYYSGRGYNISGKMGIDICAPGHSTFTSGVNNSYMLFSGTSSAAPHVVGTAALMLQINPNLTHTQIRNILIHTATSDEFTGSLPNTNWGYGKLNPEGAINYVLQNF
ncbi:MAG: S8 family serine peptidase [Ignavibacteria bacterium]|jgi:subtilisin family serine protease|nr:S8 family serine peptidase [Ignavibacteria bacterium]